MNNNNSLEKKIKRLAIIFIEKIKSKLPFTRQFKLQSKDYFCDVKPELKEYSVIELSKIAEIERKMQEALKTNTGVGRIVKGIKEEEADKLIEWVVQSGRKNIYSTCDINSSLSMLCGLCQAINGQTLINMGLTPHILGTSEIFKSKRNHAFCAVQIPVVKEGVRLQRHVCTRYVI